MLAIRMQRLGRKGHASYRVVVQDKSASPTSGKYVALLGSYNPHSKQASLVREKAEFYLKNGAQPSDRVVSLFKSEKVKLPDWVKEPTKQERKIRNPEKLRKNRPAGAEAPVKEEPVNEEQTAEVTETTANSTENEAQVATQEPANLEAGDEAEDTEESKETAENQKPEESKNKSETKDEPDAAEAETSADAEPEKT